MIKRYSDLLKLHSFEERYNYLKLGGVVGRDTFGFDRYLNQAFYKSSEWKRVRDLVIMRDNGCDLGLEGFEIHGKIYIHHMNPITPELVIDRSEDILNPEYLICVSHKTHNAIHYGELENLTIKPIERFPGDTCPWKR